MQRLLLLLLALSIGSAACSGTAPDDGLPDLSVTVAAAASDKLPAYPARVGRSRPLVVIVGENHYTELTDYVVPYGILTASGVADVMALATQPGPIRCSRRR